MRRVISTTTSLGLDHPSTQVRARQGKRGLPRRRSPRPSNLLTKCHREQELMRSTSTLHVDGTLQMRLESSHSLPATLTSLRCAAALGRLEHRHWVLPVVPSEAADRPPGTVRYPHLTYPIRELGLIFLNPRRPIPATPRRLSTGCKTPSTAGSPRTGGRTSIRISWTISAGAGSPVSIRLFSRDDRNNVHFRKREKKKYAIHILLFGTTLFLMGEACWAAEWGLIIGSSGRNSSK
jgi:hypothetical protein